MTLAQLRYFLALAEAGQYTLAAERLHIAQPSLSYAIRELENDLGFPLFRRGGRHVALTPCGEQFLRYATRALNTLDEGVRLTRQMAHPDTGTVALGYFHSISADLIPRLVERFYAAHADSPITFRFSQHLNSVILDELKRGNLDLAFCVSPDPGVEYRRVAWQRLFVAVPLAHRLAHRESIRLAELAGASMVVPHPSNGLRKTGEALFRRNAVPLCAACETQDCTSALQFVALGQAVAILPRIPAMQLQSVAVIPLVEPSYMRPVYLAWRREEALSPAVTRMRDFVLNTCVDWDTEKGPAKDQAGRADG